MAGNGEDERQSWREDDCSFEWDEASQLYFHFSSGFYHDPNAGWYYSSKDGLYYTFENGSYVLLESVKCTESEACESPRMVSDESNQDKKCLESEASQSTRVVSDVSVQDRQCPAECVTGDISENLHPPSEWLEETLIDLYLTGYSNLADNSVRGLESHESRSQDIIEMLPDQTSPKEDVASEEIEEGEWIPEVVQDAQGSSDASWDEENWRAQYGQVVQSGNEDLPALSAVDLWDWVVVTETVGRKKRQASRLVGRPVRRSAKLHPSMPVGGGLLKTAAICAAHLDLVRVASGQIYKLKTPSATYLASLSTYDSSNPTKDWGFPDLFVSFVESHESEISNEGIACGDSRDHDQLPSVKEKHKSCPYRDRAAERRVLHGGFGVGPGQKNLANDDNIGVAMGSDSTVTEEAAAEAIEISFGPSSYARRILESMGWKEGTALGNDRDGLIEPLQAVGNKGNAGLGWKSWRG